MKNIINQRLESLREVMRREHLSAFIFPSTDAHQSEYVAAHWQGRAWISGFNGSAGTAVVTLHSAALWTDSRYFLAAEEQLQGTEYQLMKLKVEGTPTIAEWLSRELAEVDSPEVGLDGMVNSFRATSSLISELRKAAGITVRTNFDPLKQIWKDRPSIPENPVEIQPLEYAGEEAKSKIARIRKALRALHADGMLVSALDDIAWTLNLRGTDVHCNPVFVSYLLIAEDNVSLFVDESKVSREVETYLRHLGVSLYNYNKVEEGLRKYAGYNILLDGDETSYYLWKTVRCQEIVDAKSPIPAMKAIKNAVEIQGYRRAMLRDGVAMVKFLKWLKPAVAAGGQTEMSIDRKLTSLRAEQELFRGISFDTIAGYAAHGAIVHYEATPETDSVLRPEGLILIDSGAQYQDGTTDITRTIALGPVTEEMKHVYTLVLKAHIQLELVKFPDGASGTQLDAVGRECMWREGFNFLHGTGHGVGSYLNVHEGPHQIRMEWMPAPLRAGMTLTDEPGLYLAGKFGVRTENTVLITSYMETEFGKFLQIEPLTLCPIDTTPIDLSMLEAEEVKWLNDYHKVVCEKLSPLLDDEEKKWLKNATKPIK
ncbi:MAG TPA: peptidase M24 [Prevotella sp.]|mgnify:FL=1|nr:aminopeptidase P family protein [uncultured Prevotella sp.]HBF06471.1 peptidase M24 [Candidatus Segatella violae]